MTMTGASQIHTVLQEKSDEQYSKLLQHKGSLQ